MNDNQFGKLVDSANIETLVERIKESPIYPAYQRAVKGDKENTDKMLAALSMVQALVDKEFDIQMKRVALDMLFNAIDLRLSSEIRNSNVEEIE
jgi:hypothetical protein